MLVVMAFSNDSIVPWNLSNRWFNCKKLLFGMNFMVSPIFREGNQCDEFLAYIGLSMQGFFFFFFECQLQLFFLGKLFITSLTCQTLCLYFFLKVLA